MINSTSDADTEAQIPECNFFLPSLQVDLLHCSPATILVHTMNLLVLYNFIFIPFSPSILFCSYFIPLAHSIPPFPHWIINRFIPVTALSYAHVLLAFLHSPLNTRSCHPRTLHSIYHLHSDFLPDPMFCVSLCSQCRGIVYSLVLVQGPIDRRL